MKRIGLLLMVPLSLVVGLWAGPVTLSPSEVLDGLLHPTADAAAIVREIRVPRVLLAFGRLCEIALDRAVPLRRLHSFITGLQFLVVRLYRLCPRVVWPHTLKDRRHRQPANRELCRTIQKRTPVNIAVLILMKKI